MFPGEFHEPDSDFSTRVASSAPASPDAASEASIAGLLDGDDLDRESARDLFSRIVEGSLPEPLMAAAFVALRIKGETAEELIGAALRIA